MSDTPMTDKAELRITCDGFNCDRHTHTLDGIEYKGGVVRKDEMAKLERQLADRVRELKAQALIMIARIEQKACHDCQYNINPITGKSSVECEVCYGCNWMPKKDGK